MPYGPSDPGIRRALIPFLTAPETFRRAKGDLMRIAALRDLEAKIRASLIAGDCTLEYGMKEKSLEHRRLRRGLQIDADINTRVATMEELITIQQVASYLKVDRFTVYRLVTQKRIPAFKVGGQWRFKQEMIDSWLMRNSNMSEYRPPVAR